MPPMTREDADTGAKSPSPASRPTAHQRFPFAALSVLGFLVAALPIELFYFPDRGNVYLLVLGVQLVMSSVAIGLARSRPDRVGAIVTGWSAGMASSMLAYYPLVGGDAVVALAAVTCLVAAMPVLLPLRLHHHLTLCATGAVGFVCLFAYGVPTSLPWPYLFLAYSAVTVLSSLGVISLEASRSDSFRREVALRRAESDLRGALGRAELAVQQRSRLIADVSHEIRTPVNVILGYTDMLLDASTEPGARAELARRIRDYGLSLDALVTQLLDLSRLDTGRVAVRPGTVELGPLLEEVAEGARLLVREKPVRVETACRGDWIETDGLRLRQILSNLVTNAARATDRGTIRIRAQRHGDRCRFTVADTGRGIPKDRQEEIFAAFEQVAPGAGGGVGLGLAIVRQLAEALGGGVTVHSAPGRGAAFSVDLPASLRKASREPPVAPASVVA